MPLKAKLANLDGLDDSVAALYRQEGEGEDAFYVLNVENAEGVEFGDASTLHSELIEIRQRRKELERTLKEFEGLDPEKVHEALAMLDNHRPEEEAQRYVDAEVEKRKQAMEAEVEAARQDAVTWKQRMRKLVVGDAIEKAAARAGFVSPKLMARLQDQLSIGVERRDDSFEAVPVDSHGRRRLAASGDGRVHPMTLDEYMRELSRLPEYAELTRRQPSVSPRVH